MKIFVIVEYRESNNTRYEVTVGVADGCDLRDEDGNRVNYHVDDFRSPEGFYIEVLGSDMEHYDYSTNQYVQAGRMDVTIHGAYYDNDDDVIDVLYDVAEEYGFDAPVIYNMCPED